MISRAMISPTVRCWVSIVYVSKFGRGGSLQATWSQRTFILVSLRVDQVPYGRLDLGRLSKLGLALNCYLLCTLGSFKLQDTSCVSLMTQYSFMLICCLRTEYALVESLSTSSFSLNLITRVGPRQI